MEMFANGGCRPDNVNKTKENVLLETRCEIAEQRVNEFNGKRKEFKCMTSFLSAQDNIEQYKK